MMVMLERELKLHLCNNIINVIQINNIKTPQIWLSYKIEKCNPPPPPPSKELEHKTIH